MQHNKLRKERVQRVVSEGKHDNKLKKRTSESFFLNQEAKINWEKTPVDAPEMDRKPRKKLEKANVETVTKEKASVQLKVKLIRPKSRFGKIKDALKRRSRWFNSKVASLFSKKKVVVEIEESTKVDSSMNFSDWSSTSGNALDLGEKIMNFPNVKRLQHYKTSPSRISLPATETRKLRRHKTAMKQEEAEFHFSKRFPNQKPSDEALKKEKRMRRKLAGTKNTFYSSQEEKSMELRRDYSNAKTMRQLVPVW